MSEDGEDIKPSNVRAALQAIRVTFDTESLPDRIVFYQEKSRESKGFVELWDLDYPLQSLTLTTKYPIRMDQHTRIQDSSLIFSLLYPRGMETQLDVRSAKGGDLTGSTGYSCI
jgi:hypothetical protein